MPELGPNSEFPGEIKGRSLGTSATLQLEYRREAANCNEIRFEGPPEKVPSENGLVYKRFVRIRNGEPIRGEGQTIPEAEERVAREILLKLDDGSIIFNQYQQLEFHKKHESKFSKKKRK